MPPREPCPTGPLPFTKAAERLAMSFDRLGWHWWPAEAAVISENYDGRPGCNGCGICNGCPRGSMSKFSLSVWPKALMAGATLHSYARVTRIEKGRDGRATGAIYVDRNTNETDFQAARVVVVAATASARPAYCWRRIISPTALTRSGAISCTIRSSLSKCGSTSRSKATWATWLR